MAKTENIELTDTEWTAILTESDGPAAIQVTSSNNLKIRADNTAPSNGDTVGVTMGMSTIRQLTVDTIGAGGTIYARAAKGTSSVVVMSLGV